MPAKLTRVGQLSTTTGTGNFTLGAALTSMSPAVRTFNAVAGNGATGFLFFYSILHKTLNESEDGIGYMSDATTLVRHKVFRSSNANAVVNFSAGDKDVICTDQGNLQDIFFGGSNSTSASTKWQIPNNQAGAASSSAMTANRLYAVPLVITNRLNIIEWMISVTTLAAGATIYAALAERINRTEFRVVRDLGSVDASTAADKGFPLGGGLLPAGNYFMLIVSDGAPSVRMRSINYADLGSTFGGAYQWLYGTLTWSGFWPSTVTGITSAINNSAAPSVLYRTEDDYA